MSLFSRVSFADFEQANFCWEKPWKMLSFADSHVKTLKWSHSFSQNWTAFIHRFLVGLRETASHYGRISCVLTGAMSLKQFQGFQGKIFATVNCDYSPKSFSDKKKVFLNELITIKTENDTEFFGYFRFLTLRSNRLRKTRVATLLTTFLVLDLRVLPFFLFWIWKC